MWRFLNIRNPQAAHGARMGQPLLVVAKFTDGDYQRLEGEGRRFSLRDDSMDSSKNGGLSMKSCGLMGLIITNGGFSNFKYYKLGILGIQVMIMDFMDFILDQLVQCQSKGNHVFSPPHGRDFWTKNA